MSTALIKREGPTLQYLFELATRTFPGGNVALTLCDSDWNALTVVHKRNFVEAIRQPFNCKYRDTCKWGCHSTDNQNKSYRNWIKVALKTLGYDPTATGWGFYLKSFTSPCRKNKYPGLQEAISDMRRAVRHLNAVKDFLEPYTLYGGSPRLPLQRLIEIGIAAAPGEDICITLVNSKYDQITIHANGMSSGTINFQSGTDKRGNTYVTSCNPYWIEYSSILVGQDPTSTDWVFKLDGVVDISIGDVPPMQVNTTLYRLETTLRRLEGIYRVLKPYVQQNYREVCVTPSQYPFLDREVWVNFM